jgi:hypothetical protein
LNSLDELSVLLNRKNPYLLIGAGYERPNNDKAIECDKSEVADQKKSFGIFSVTEVMIS